MERMQRYSAIIDPHKLVDAHVAVIGVGAIGRQIAIQLAAMGVGNLTLVDFDNVDESNLGTQGWLFEDLGLPKVEALAHYLKRVNPDCTITSCMRRFRKSDDSLHDVVFACVDSMKARKIIFESCAKSGHASFFADGRMVAEAFRAFAVTAENGGIEYYADSLYSDSEAVQASCTARTTIYCSNVIAGCLITLYTQFLRGWPVPKEVEMTLAGFAMETIR
jgi:molybdopterin/thiamine biosynthesis adenylyltransferase